MTNESWVGLAGLCLGVLGFILRGYISKPDALKREVELLDVAVKASMAVATTSIVELKTIVTEHIRKCDALPPETLLTKLTDFRDLFSEHVREDRAFMLESKTDAKIIQTQWEGLNKSLAVIEERVKLNSADAEHVRNSLHGLREAMAGIVGRLDMVKMSKLEGRDTK